MIKFFRSSALVAIISSLFRSAVLYAFWLFLPLFLSAADLDILAYNYALSLSLIGLLDLGGVSGVALTKIGNSNNVQNNKSLGISLLALQIFSLILILAFIHFFIEATYSFIITLTGVFTYFTFWSTIKKITENTKKNLVVYFLDIIVVSTSVAGVFVLSGIIQNPITSFTIIGFPLSIFYIIFFRKKTNLFVLNYYTITEQIKYLMKLNWPLLLSSLGVFIVIFIEREFLSNFKEGPERPFQYILTVLLQISQLFIIAFQGLYNRIWHYEASKSNESDSIPKYLENIYNLISLVSPLAFLIVIYLIPNLYSISLGKQELILTGIIGILALVVQLMSVKVGSLGLWKTIATYSIVSLVVNLLIMFMFYYVVSIGFQDYALELILLKYIIVSIFQIIYLTYVLKKAVLPETKFTYEIVKKVVLLIVCLCLISIVGWLYAALIIIIHFFINRKSNYRSLTYLSNV